MPSLPQALKAVILLILGLLCLGTPACADEPGVAAPPAVVPADPPAVTRPSIVRGNLRLDADTMSMDADNPTFTAAGNVQLASPQGLFNASRASYNTQSRIGLLDNAKGFFTPFHFFAQSLTLDPKHGERLQNGSLTTCNHEEHPHYQLLVRDFRLYPDNRYDARRVTLQVAGHKLITIPRIRGQLNDKDTAIAKPAISFGESHLDGAFVAFQHQLPLGPRTDLNINARLGTENLLRGGLFLEQRFTLPGSFARGKISFVNTLREDVSNRLIDGDPKTAAILPNLAISRLPALEGDLDKIRLPGLLHGFSLHLGAGTGSYHEYPTGVVSSRTQAWGIARSPSVNFGPLRLYGEYGVRDAHYPDSSYWTHIGSINLESSPTAPTYLNLAYLQRSASGQTPFLFDQVQIPNELFSEFEMPVTRNGLWRLGFWHRLDLTDGETRDYNVTAIYHMDCISYGLSYDRASRSFGVSLVLNAFGSFRRPAPGVGFTQ